MNTFGTPRRVLVRGEGAYVWDADGRRYLDLLGGIAVNALGHAHPTLTAAVTRAARHARARLELLRHARPRSRSPSGCSSWPGRPPGSRVFFTNSGTEANEAVVKLARRPAGPGSSRSEGAFHGRTMGALALTHKAAYREPFEPLPGGVEFLPFGDLAALEAAMADDVAALVLELVQGEAGVRPLPPGTWRRRARARRRGTAPCSSLDEVQTGIGRTGAWFAHQHPDLGGGVRPDVMTLAKGLGGGFPIGARGRLRRPRGAAARPGPARHHLRRQPGRRRGRPGDARRDRARRAAEHVHARWAARARPGPSRRSRWSSRGARRRPAARRSS